MREESRDSTERNSDPGRECPLSQLRTGQPERKEGGRRSLCADPPSGKCTRNQHLKCRVSPPSTPRQTRAISESWLALSSTRVSIPWTTHSRHQIKKEKNHFSKSEAKKEIFSPANWASRSGVSFTRELGHVRAACVGCQGPQGTRGPRGFLQSHTARPKEYLRISLNPACTTPKCLHSPSHGSSPTSRSGLNKNPHFAAEELRYPEICWPGEHVADVRTWLFR